MKKEDHEIVYIKKIVCEGVHRFDPYFAYRLNGRLVALCSQVDKLPSFLNYPETKGEHVYMKCLQGIFGFVNEDENVIKTVPKKYVRFINRYLDYLENFKGFFVEHTFMRDQKMIDDYDIELWCKITHNEKIYCGLEISLWVRVYCAGIAFYESEIFFVSHMWSRSLNRSKNLERLDFDANTISEIIFNQKDNDIQIRLTSSISTKNVDFWVIAIRK